MAKYEMKLTAVLSYALADGKPVSSIWYALFGDKYRAEGHEVERVVKTFEPVTIGAKTVTALVNDEYAMIAELDIRAKDWARATGLDTGLAIQGIPWISVNVERERVK